jgi:hypothetical protein
MTVGGADDAPLLCGLGIADDARICTSFTGFTDTS